MGKATIQSIVGEGQFSIKVDRAEDLINEKIAWLDEQINLIDNLSLPSDSMLARRAMLVKRKEVLQELLNNSPIKAWCADYSPGLTGKVDLLDINGETFNHIIAPATPGHHTLSPGQITPILAQSGEQSGLAFAIFPGWQKFKPTYRLAEITSLDISANTCSVDLDEANSFITGESINRFDSLDDVPIKYMSCDALAFLEGDRVVIEFIGQDWGQPQVIGFETSPRSCAVTCLVVITNQDGSKAFAWDLYSNSLVLPVDSMVNITADLALLGFDAPVETEYDTVSESWQFNATVVKDAQLDQGSYVSGIYLYLDWERSDSSHLPGSWYYDEVAGEWTREWDYRYVEAPDFSKDAGLNSGDYIKGFNLFQIQRMPFFLDADKRDEFIALSGNTWDWPVNWVQMEGAYVPRERVQRFCHEMFDIPIKDVALIDENTTYCTRLLDNWSEVDGGGFSYPGMDPFAGYLTESSGGLGETDLQAVVFEVYQACTHVPLTEDACEDEDFYDRRVFNLFGHLKDHLIGVPKDLMDLLNTYRTDNGRTPLALNFGLTKAAERHAIDAALNGLTGETGSDSSTVQSRMDDAGYYLGIRTGLVPVDKKQIMEVGEYLGASDVLASWQADPTINSELLSADYLEASIALKTSDSGIDYLVLLLAGTYYRWPGFCPVDTTALDIYMASSFPNSYQDYMQIPRVYVVDRLS